MVFGVLFYVRTNLKTFIKDHFLTLWFFCAGKFNLNFIVFYRQFLNLITVAKGSSQNRFDFIVEFQQLI